MTKKKQTKTIVIPDSFLIVAVDGALDRPGFSVISYDKGDIKVLNLSNLNNKGKSKTHGEKLNDILQFFQSTVVPKVDTPTFFIRQHAVGQKFFNDTAIYEQVGMLNWWLWMNHQTEWHEIYPSSVKKLITGNGRATKEDVRSALSTYVGEQQYACDDESDALAIALAFLIQINLLETK